MSIKKRRWQRIDWSPRYCGGSNFWVKKLCKKQQREIGNCCTYNKRREDNEDRETPNEYKKRKKNERKTQWMQKQFHGQFIRQTKGKESED